MSVYSITLMMYYSHYVYIFILQPHSSQTILLLLINYIMNVSMNQVQLSSCIMYIHSNSPYGLHVHRSSLSRDLLAYIALAYSLVYPPAGLSNYTSYSYTSIAYWNTSFIPQNIIPALLLMHILLIFKCGRPFWLTIWTTVFTSNLLRGFSHGFCFGFNYS